ncbi:hypothetical protein HPT25_03985 [Bacillus sp. BRMEA1]|uniref:hypothetical protein n=1 Tax=Neobacillus endophyticus TaxID=2738405 RepID=UPI0015635618|nr:hypothetical protein [Neobacillus endophyticus]NRD76649.1 hypothetical protein [Neobacillus endophyticus]
MEKDNIEIEPAKKNLLSHVLGRVVATEPIDLDNMRQVTQKQVAQMIYEEDKLKTKE